MIRRDVAARKLLRAQAWLDDASAILQRPFAEYRDNARERDLSAFYLMLADAVMDGLVDRVTLTCGTGEFKRPPGY
jgi:hypothetical protein